MSDLTPARRSTDNQRTIPWAQISVVITVIAAIGGGLAWITGGIHPQWQQDISELRASNVGLAADLKTAVAKLEAAQQTQAAAASSDKAVLTARIDSAQQLFTSRLDAMWRPSDYADRDSHLSRLDQVYDALRDRMTQQEYSTKDLTNRLSGLSTAPVRNPGR
jgi:hypothetical protein